MFTSEHPRILLAMGRQYNDLVHYGVAKYAGQHHWHLTNLFSEDSTRVKGRDCDAVLAVLTERNSFVEAVLALKRPTVSLSLCSPVLPLPQTTGDNREMGRSAAQHFLERGFRSFIWFSEFMNPAAALRLEGYKLTVGEAGYPCRAMTVSETFSTPPPWNRFREWVHQSVREAGTPCAVYAHNDLQADEWMSACLQSGLRVPEDVAILGTDDNPLVCETAAVPLSSIRNDLRELGWRAAEALDALLKGAPPCARIIEVPHRGIAVRRSSDIFAVNDPALSQALKFIHTSFRENIGVPEIAAASGLSRRALERRFRATLHSSALEKLHQLRINETRRLLRETPLPVADIAARCGFTSPEYLHRVFKQNTGITPRHYRLQHRK